MRVPVSGRSIHVRNPFFYFGGSAACEEAHHIGVMGTEVDKSVKGPVEFAIVFPIFARRSLIFESGHRGRALPVASFHRNDLAELAIVDHLLDGLRSPVLTKAVGDSDVGLYVSEFGDV